MAPRPTLDPVVMKAVETLDYRVTVGDIAAQGGLNVNLAQQGLLILASEAGGHLQVAESGEVAYLFPKNFRTVLRNKFLGLRLKETWDKVWRILFYLIRVSFGVALILSILLIVVTIAVIIIAASSSNNNSSSRNNNRRSSGGGGLFPRIWVGPNWYWFFSPSYRTRRNEQRLARAQSNDPEAAKLNFLEAIFSFLFGDGNPNFDLEDRRWQAIGTVVRNSQGAVTAEQIAPYLDNLGKGYAEEYEEYMLPVLTTFNGKPEVSPDGQIVYHFPELQTTAAEYTPKPVKAYLEESPWRFSEATSGQLTMAAGLGLVNFVGALVLGGLLGDGQIALQLGGLVAFAHAIYWLLLGYGTAFLSVPSLRYFWIKAQNSKIDARNESRLERALVINQASPELQKKLDYAKQFASETVIRQEDLVYTTETDLLEQDLNHSAKLDAEWQKRINQSGT